MAVHFVRTNSTVSSRRPHLPNNSPPLRHRYRRRLRHNREASCVTGPTTRSSTRASPTSVDTSLMGSVDSFVRLVSLRLVVERDQPYISLDGISQSRWAQALSSLPQEIFVRYHDVDGILDFLVLRGVFDEAVNRFWKAGKQCFLNLPDYLFNMANLFWRTESIPILLTYFTLVI